MARSVGMQVNKHTTSKDTRIFSLGMVWDLMNSTKIREFLTWELVKPTIEESRLARSLESSYVGEDTNDTMGQRETPGLCTLSSPYSSGTLPAPLSSSAMKRHRGGVARLSSGLANMSSSGSRKIKVMYPTASINLRSPLSASLALLWSPS